MGIIESVQHYDLNIPAGGAQNIDVAGDRVQFIASGDPFAQIEIRPNYAQGNITLRPGQGFKFSEQVTRWVVFNRGAVALKGYLLIGSGDFFDQRISGTVDVIDGGKARSLSGSAYIGLALTGTAGAGNFQHVQLWNPAGSGKNLMVEQLQTVSTVSTGFYHYAKSTALASLLAYVPQPKMLGHPSPSVAQLRNHAGALLYPSGDARMLTNGPTNVSSLFKPAEPIVIPPGWGWIVQGQTIAGDTSVTFEWYEEQA
ncbi:hypothetical protein K6V92_00380 [Cupriavidus respiraculi]|uniref:hypothetical protein n=1 Tax=Cupriavidus respiraculi TaxID=195930 RepID=UPI001C988768|nr:hypothetical protein [Cupriavidus respiraculi]MBY4945080.1 hypothetical protein [Cupriavidus respiraculi]